MRFHSFGAAACLILSLVAVPACAAPQAGWWWNPDESGRGYFVESQDDLIYLAGYFYESDGRATWLVAGGPNTDPYHYTGRLLAYSNGQTLLGDYKPPNAPTDAGAVTISFSDDTHGTIVWPGGTIPIVRQGFGSGEPELETHNGWWWNAEESGRGYSIERQGDKLFVVGFMYDDAGKPVWYYSAGPMTTATHYAGPWLQFAGGQTLGGPYRPPTAPRRVGQLTIDFTATNAAVMEFGEAPAATDKLESRQQAVRSKLFNVATQFKARQVAPPATLKGGFTYNESYLIEAEGSRHTTTVRWQATGVVLELEPNGVTPTSVEKNRANGPWLPLSQVSGKLTLEIEQETTSSIGHCVAPRQAVTVDLAFEAVKVTMNYYGQYFGSVDQPPVPFTLKFACMDNKGNRFEITDEAPQYLKFDLGTGTATRSGVPGSRVLFGSQAPETFVYGTGKYETSYVWNFVATQ